jgi:hypothetical protein
MSIRSRRLSIVSTLAAERRREPAGGDEGCVDGDRMATA